MHKTVCMLSQRKCLFFFQMRRVKTRLLKKTTTMQGSSRSSHVGCRDGNVSCSSRTPISTKNLSKAFGLWQLPKSYRRLKNLNCVRFFWSTSVRAKFVAQDKVTYQKDKCQCRCRRLRTMNHATESEESSHICRIISVTTSHFSFGQLTLQTASLLIII